MDQWEHGGRVPYRKGYEPGKLGKKWLGEGHEVTPIMEGIEFNRPKSKPDPFTAMWGRLPIIVNKADKKAEKKAKKK